MGNQTSTSDTNEISTAEGLSEILKSITDISQTGTTPGVTPVYQVTVKFKKGTKYKEKKTEQATIKLWLNKYSCDLNEQMCTYLEALDHENLIYREILNKLDGSTNCCSPNFLQLGLSGFNVSYADISTFVVDSSEFPSLITMGYHQTLDKKWKFNYSITLTEKDECSFPVWFASTLALDPKKSFGELANVVLQTVAACYVHECAQLTHNQLHPTNVSIQKTPDRELIYHYAKGTSSPSSICINSQYTVKIKDYTAANSKLMHGESHPPENSTSTVIDDMREFLRPLGKLREWDETAKAAWAQKTEAEKAEVSAALEAVLSSNIPISVINGLRGLVGNLFMDQVSQCADLAGFVRENIEQEKKNISETEGDSLVFAAQERALGVYTKLCSVKTKVWEANKHLVADWVEQDSNSNYHLKRWHPEYSSTAYFTRLCDVLNTADNTGSIMDYFDEFVNIFQEGAEFYCTTKKGNKQVYTCGPVQFTANGQYIDKTIMQYFQEVTQNHK
jgi:hypothetical protein